MRIAMIVAQGRNRVIGRNGALPWRVPVDTRYFVAQTAGKPMIMGRKTWKSLKRETAGAGLPGRPSLIVTRRRDWHCGAAPFASVAAWTARTPGTADVVPTLDAAFATAALQAAVLGVEEIMVIGGGEIYAAALPHADRVYLTDIDLEPEGETLFPVLDPAQWRRTSCTAHGPDGDAPGLRFLIYDRRR